jgi:NADPH:quinone reductase-like Zn-dependent oxidoreductase
LAYKRSLAPKGVYVMAGGKVAQMFQVLLLGRLISEKDGRKLMAVSAHMDQKDLLILKEMLENGQIVPAIDRRYPLSEAPEALRYLGTGHARGKIIIDVTTGTQSI